MAEIQPNRPADRRGFRIAIICALTLEADMVEMAFDRDWSEDGAKYGKAAGDLNTYSTGVIAGHNVVLVYCSGIGSNSASQVASGLRASFTQIQIALVVGICGAVPLGSDGGEFVLGDCVISSEVVQFDFGRAGPGGFQKKDDPESLAKSSIESRALMAKLKTRKNMLHLSKRLMFHLQALQKADPERTRYPGINQDRLYTSAYEHTHHPPANTCEQCNLILRICEKDCEALGCKDDQLVQRKRLIEDQAPRIHFGTIGSSNTVLRCGTERDRLAKVHSLVAFEMEGSGVWSILPTILIKAACDYADSHKHKGWQNYAAAVAAAALKAVLEMLELPEDDGLLQHDEIRLNMLDMMARLLKDASVTKALNAVPQQTRPLARSLPFQRDENFVGRDDILTSLQTRYKSCKPGYQLRSALLGMGGVGKSQIAIEYAYRLLDWSSHHSVFWIFASNATRFQQSYKDIAYLAGIEIVDDTKLLDSVCQWLSNESSGQHTLILDNIDERAILREVRNGKQLQQYLPTTSNVSILMTSRSQLAAVDLVGIKNIIRVEVMNEQSSLELLKAKIDVDKESEELALDLIRQLEGLPLAIVHAGAYIAVRAPRMTLTKYLELFKTEKSRDKLMNETEILDNRRDTEATRTFLATWQISFDAIRRDNSDTLLLLAVMSLLDGHSIPVLLLQHSNILNRSGSDVLEDGLALLSSYSLVTAMPNSQAYKMHRMVQLSMTTWMKRENWLGRLSSLSVWLVRDCFSSYAHAGVLRIREMILPHARKVLNYNIEEIEERLMLMNNVAGYLQLIDRTQEADYMTQEAIALVDSNSALDRDVVASTLSCRSNVLKRQGHLAEAQSLGTAALEMANSKVNPQLVVNILIQLSAGAIHLGSPEKAEEYSKQALQLCLDNWGPDEAITISAISNHASVLRLQGKVEGLEDTKRRVLSSLIKLHGPTHIMTLLAKRELAELLGQQKRFEEVEILEKEILADMRSTLSSDHILLLEMLRKLSETLTCLGRWQEAENLSREAFEIVKRTPELGHEAFWPTMLEFLKVLLNRNKKDELESIVRDVLAICRQTPPEKYLTAEGLSALNWALRTQGKHEETK